MASVELFKVTCVTCRASLSVRNAALIGQIVACPKCNSMVEIAPPAPTAAVAAVAAIAPIFAQPAATQPVAKQPAFEEQLENFADASPAEVPAAPPVTDAPPVSELASVLEVGTASSAKFIIWSAASFVIGATLVGAFLILRSGDTPEQVPVAEATTTTPIAAPIQKAEPVVSNESTPVVEKPATKEAVSNKSNPDVIAEVEEPGDENPFAVPEAQAEPPLTGAIELPAEEVAADQLPVTPTVSEPEAKLVISDEPRVARKFDPLALDPEQMDLSTVSAAGSHTENDAAGKADLQKAETSEPQTKEPPANLGKVVKIKKETGRNTSALSAEIQLKRVLPAVAVKSMPILDFLTMASQLAGVPVSISPEQLQMAGVSARAPVSIDAKDKSLADVLATVLGPLHLEATMVGPQIVVIRQDPTKARSVDYPIDDLLGGQTTAIQFAKWIEALIAPESWQSAGGDGQITASEKSLRIEQTQAVQYEVLFFLERIRLAKQLPLKSRYPKHLLTAEPHAAAIADRISAPAVFTFSVETPLAEVFYYWQSEMGLPVFVDWPALAAAKLWPDSLITCAIANEPWHVALNNVLEPLDLGWRAAPGGSIQITSRAKIETQPQLDIYPANQWHGNAVDATVIHDAVNNLTYVRAPATAHK